jgi:uncharacterized repeat protein (TIGR01451 family)
LVVIAAAMLGAIGMCAPAAAAVQMPTLTASFAPPDINPGQSSMLTFALKNNDPNPLTNVGFTQPAPSGLFFQQNAATTCPGAVAGVGTTGATGQLVFTDMSLAAGAECVVTVGVFATQAGVVTTISDPLTADRIASGPTASATLTVATAPQISAAFALDAVIVGTNTRLSVTIVDANQGVSLTGVNFTGTLSSGLSIASPPNPQSPCGQLTAPDGSASFGFSGGTLAPFQPCTVSFDVAGAGAGQQTATISKPASVEGGTAANGATATVKVLGPPSVSVAVPASGAVYDVGQTLAADFSCSDDPNGPGVVACSGTQPSGTPIDTGRPGTYSFSVTATSGDGQTTEQTISYSVQLFAPTNVAAPAISGEPTPGAKLACAPGGWTDGPVAIAYQWQRNGVALSAATGATYAVQRLDQGSTLTCAVAARNAAGTAHAASGRLAIPVVPAPGCPAVRHRTGRTAIGPARLGMTRTEARAAFSGSSVRHRRRSDTFCLTPAGIQLGYANRHAVWVSARAPVYSVRGIAPGASLSSAARRLPGGVLLTHAGERWYVVPGSPASAVFGARDGVVEVVAIADPRFAGDRAADLALLTAFAR